MNEAGKKIEKAVADETKSIDKDTKPHIKNAEKQINSLVHLCTRADLFFCISTYLRWAKSENGPLASLPCAKAVNH